MFWSIILAWLVSFQTEVYFVTDIQGRALTVRNNVNIEVTRGGRLYPDDKIRFTTPNTVIRLAGKRGTFVAKHQADLNNRTQRSAEFWSVLRNELLPTQKAGELKSRAGVISTEIEAQAFFRSFSDSGKPVTILDTLLVEVNQSYFTDTASNFFYLSYKKGKEEINKKIPWKKSNASLTLSFDHRLLLIDGKETRNTQLLNTKLYFYRSKLSQSFYISDLNIRITKFAAIMPELCIVAKAFDLPADPKKANKDQITFFTDYINAYHGSINEELFIRKYLPVISSKNCLHE